MTVLIGIYGFIILLSALLKVKKINQTLFVIWLKFLSVLANKIFKSDNRYFSDWDEELWGCDYFNGFNKINSKKFLILVENKEQPKNLRNQYGVSNPNEPLYFLNKLEKDCLSARDFQKALFIARLCRKDLEKDLAVLNFLENLKNGEGVFKIGDSRVVWNCKNDDEVELSILDFNTHKVLVKIIKFMTFNEMFALNLLLKRLEEIKLPILNKRSESIHKEGLNPETLLSNIESKVVKVCENKSGKGFFIHMPEKTPDLNPIQYRSDYFATTNFEEDSRITNKTWKSPSSNSVMNRCNKVVLCKDFSYSPYSFNKNLKTIVRFLTDLLIFIRLVFAFLIFYFRSFNKIVLIVLLLSMFLESFFFIKTIKRFRLKFLLYNLLGERISKLLFKVLFNKLGNEYSFCGLNQFTPTDVKQYLIFNTSDPRRNNDELVKELDYNSVNLSDKTFYFEKCIVIFKKERRYNKFVFKVSISDKKMIKSEIMMLTDRQIKILFLTLETISTGFAQGVFISDHKITGRRIIHFGDIGEILKSIKMNTKRIFIYKIKEGESALSGLQQVEIDKESLSFCRLNKWVDNKAIAAMKYYTEKYWGVKTIANDFYTLLPCNKQSLNKEWFEGVGNKELKIYLSGASEILYKTMKFSYYKVQVMNKSRALLETVKILENEGFELVITDEKVNSNEGNLLQIIEFERPEEGTIQICQNDDIKGKAQNESKTEITGLSLLNNLETRLEEFKMANIRIVNNRFTFRKTEIGGFAGWKLDNDLKPVGNAKARKLQDAEWFSQWKGSLTPEEFTIKLNEKYRYLEKKKFQHEPVLNNIFTLDGAIKDIRFNLNDGLREGIIYKKNNKPIKIESPEKKKEVKLARFVKLVEFKGNNTDKTINLNEMATKNIHHKEFDLPKLKSLKGKDEKKKCRGFNKSTKYFTKKYINPINTVVKSFRKAIMGVNFRITDNGVVGPFLTKNKIGFKNTNLKSSFIKNLTMEVLKIVNKKGKIKGKEKEKEKEKEKGKEKEKEEGDTSISSEENEDSQMKVRLEKLRKLIENLNYLLF